MAAASSRPSLRRHEGKRIGKEHSLEACWKAIGAEGDHIIWITERKEDRLKSAARAALCFVIRLFVVFMEITHIRFLYR
jgi:hypothetical protein